MKKVFLIAAAAALVLSSCSKNEVSENKSESNLIGFSSYSGRSTTKAGDTFVSGTTLPSGKTNKFGVFAFHTGATAFDPAAGTANFMSDVSVTYNGGGNVVANYSYDPLRYWPSDGANHLLSFFAYYPAENGAITGKTVAGALNEYKYNFTVPSDAANQVDFMISDVVKDQKYSINNGVVPLVFHHMLTQVRFRVTLDKEYANTVIKIKGLQLTNINSTGTLSVVAAADGTVKTNSIWSAQSTPVSFTVPVTETALTYASPASYYEPSSPAATLLMLPQTIAVDDASTTSVDEAAKLVITYTYQTTPGMTTAIEDTKTVNLSKTELLSWEKNNNILYSITLGLNAIRFTATVSDWDAQKTVNL